MRKIRLAAASVLTSCLLAMFAPAIQAQENRNVKIINRASSPIRYLYASNVDNSKWSQDLLGPLNVIFTNYYQIFNLDDSTGHCLYDIKAVLSDGRQASA